MSANNSRFKLKRKHGINIIAVILLCAIVSITAIFVIRALWGGNTYTPDGVVDVELHFFDTTTNVPIVELRRVSGNNNLQFLNATLSEWIGGSVNLANTHYLPENATISAVILLPSNNVRITASEELNELSPLQLNQCFTLLVWSITSLEFVNDVEINIGDVQFVIFDAENTPISLLNRGNMHLRPVTTPYEDIEVIAYFSDAMGMHLEAETRRIRRNPNRPIERYIIDILLEGPEQENLMRTIPQGVTLLNVETNADTGIAIVNFCLEFRADSPLAEAFMVFAIVNSLTELDHVNKVQFLIENNLITEENGFHSSLTSPIERDESLIR